MKQETIISRLEKITEDKENVDKQEFFRQLNKLIQELKLDTIDTYKVGKFNANAYFKRFLKRVEDYRPVYKNVHKQKSGKYACCDGRRFIQFEDENDAIAQALYDSKDDEGFMQYDTIGFEADRELKINMTYLEKLIAFNKVNKLKGGNQVPYIAEFYEDTDEYIGFDPTYLIELLQLNNTDTITLGKTKVSITQIKSDKYTCLLCPIRIVTGAEKTDDALRVREELKTKF